MNELARLKRFADGWVKGRLPMITMVIRCFTRRPKTQTAHHPAP